MLQKIFRAGYCCTINLILMVFTCYAQPDNAEKWQYLISFHHAMAQSKYNILHFTQTLPDQSQNIDGAVVLDARNKFRIVYYKPYPLTFMGYPEKVVVYDFEMEHLTFIKKEENPLDFLTNDPKALDKYFTLIGNAESDTTNKVALRHIKHDKIIEITLNKSNSLPQEITFYNDEGNSTIYFTKIEQLQKFNDDIFKINTSNDEPLLLIRSEEQLLKLYKAA